MAYLFVEGGRARDCYARNEGGGVTAGEETARRDGGVGSQAVKTPLGRRGSSALSLRF